MEDREIIKEPEASDASAEHQEESQSTDLPDDDLEKLAGGMAHQYTGLPSD